MEHRKFRQWLDEPAAELTHAQAQKPIDVVQQRGDGDEVLRLPNKRFEQNPECPHCGSKRRKVGVRNATA